MALHGAVDHAESPFIAGWVCTEEESGECPAVDVVILGRTVASVTADRARRDLADRKGCYGFRLKVPEGFAPRDLATGRLKVVARTNEDCRELKVWRLLEVAGRLDDAIGDDLPKALALLPGAQRRTLLHALAGEPAGPPAGGRPEQGPGVGAVSEDEAAIIGANGHMFLFQGSNRVQEMYADTSPNPKTIAQWKHVCALRMERFRSRGIRYVQMMIPEKSSAMPDLVPYPIKGPSALWQGAMAELRALDGGWDLLDGAAVFGRAAVPEATFRLLDSHLSTYGSSLLVEAVAGGCPGQSSHQSSHRVGGYRWERRAGDLGRRFAAAPAGEPMEQVRLATHLLDAEGGTLTPELVGSADPPTGHLGIRRVWRCANAPIAQRVVCFGNSFFERGGSSTHLSWWFSRLFREFHFVWSVDFDWDYLDSVAPDAVIAQSIERFLRRPPQA